MNHNALVCFQLQLLACFLMLDKANICIMQDFVHRHIWLFSPNYKTRHQQRKRSLNKYTGGSCYLKFKQWMRSPGGDCAAQDVTNLNLNLTVRASNPYERGLSFLLWLKYFNPISFYPRPFAIWSVIFSSNEYLSAHHII